MALVRSRAFHPSLPLMNSTLTFLSKSLDKRITFSSFETLSIVELRALYAELFIADESMKDSLLNAERKAAADGVSVDPDWVHRIKKKHRVCMAFLVQAKQLLDAVIVDSNIHLAYQRHLDALLLEELGPVVWQEIKDLAKEKAGMDAQACATPRLNTTAA